MSAAVNRKSDNAGASSWLTSPRKSKPSLSVVVMASRLSDIPGERITAESFQDTCVAKCTQSAVGNRCTTSFLVAEFPRSGFVENSSETIFASCSALGLESHWSNEGGVLGFPTTKAEAALKAFLREDVARCFELSACKEGTTIRRKRRNKHSFDKLPFSTANGTR